MLVVDHYPLTFSSELRSRIHSRHSYSPLRGKINSNHADNPSPPLLSEESQEVISGGGSSAWPWLLGVVRLLWRIVALTHSPVLRSPRRLSAITFSRGGGMNYEGSPLGASS